MGSNLQCCLHASHGSQRPAEHVGQAAWIVSSRGERELLIDFGAGLDQARRRLGPAEGYTGKTSSSSEQQRSSRSVKELRKT